LFSAAAASGMREKLEMLCFKLAMKQAYFLPAGKLLFLNFHPATLAGNSKIILDSLGDMREQVVVELSESHGKIRYLHRSLDDLRSAGVRIALDDVGAGDRALANLCEYRADYLKLDRSLTEGLMQTKNGMADLYRSMVRLLVDYAWRAGVEVIAEGVETESQLLETMMSGIHLMQGFYFSLPQPAEYWLERIREPERGVAVRG
jgi:EAL domain-containing protein (putative c-di-GMP-specific phosphodiesterase class I)